VLFFKGKKPEKQASEKGGKKIELEGKIALLTKRKKKKKNTSIAILKERGGGKKGRRGKGENPLFVETQVRAGKQDTLCGRGKKKKKKMRAPDESDVSEGGGCLCGEGRALQRGGEGGPKIEEKAPDFPATGIARFTAVKGKKGRCRQRNIGGKKFPEKRK